MFSLKEASCRAEASADALAGQSGSEFCPQWPELSLRSGVVPFRLDANGRLEFLLIRRNGHLWWSLPKGRPTPGQTLAHSAALEAYEEAGIRGAMGSAPLGSFQYRKRGRGILDPAQLVELVLFSLKVEIEEESWPERGTRQRRWIDQERAPNFVAPGPLRNLLKGLNSQRLT
jgi:8-oxo-dGTP pyrophosphatase MutT (NUDIX family)